MLTFRNLKSVRPKNVAQWSQVVPTLSPPGLTHSKPYILPTQGCIFYSTYHETSLFFPFFSYNFSSVICSFTPIELRIKSVSFSTNSSSIFIRHNYSAQFISIISLNEADSHYGGPFVMSLVFFLWFFGSIL